jgi:hypothetical protein
MQDNEPAPKPAYASGVGYEIPPSSAAHPDIQLNIPTDRMTQYSRPLPINTGPSATHRQLGTSVQVSPTTSVGVRGRKVEVRIRH